MRQNHRQSHRERPCAEERVPERGRQEGSRGENISEGMGLFSKAHNPRQAQSQARDVEALQAGSQAAGCPVGQAALLLLGLSPSFI